MTMLNFLKKGKNKFSASFLKKLALDKKEFKDIKELLKYIDSLEKRVENLTQALDSLKKETKLAVQKVGLKRFNPFSEIGGDQSFTIALLDGNNDGVIITSIYSNDGNRVYAKSIEKGESKYVLSEEEKEVIEKAISEKLKA
jgi:hypothetical protein